MHLTVVGTGLIGGSFARAARGRGLFSHITGIDPDPDNARRALDLGVVDVLAESVPADADAVLLAGPSDTIADWVIHLAGHRGVLFDTGSVKAAVLADIEARLGAPPARFVPCHPLAGSERSGPEAADPTLFQDAEVIVTPTVHTDAPALHQVELWWRAVGARVVTMAADQHDRVLALTSHLPHLLVSAYLQLVEDDHLPHAAGGFRDFTRIGAADARMWSPILRLNRGAVLDVLDGLAAELSRARTLIDAADDAALAAFLERAAERRRGLSQ